MTIRGLMKCSTRVCMHGVKGPEFILSVYLDPMTQYQLNW